MTIKARDIRHDLKGSGVDPKVMRWLEMAAEEIRSLDKNIAECQAIVVMLVERVEMFMKLGDVFKTKIEELERSRTDPNPELKGDTSGLN